MGDLIQRRKATADEMMRGAICEAATAVLAEVGFGALTMDRVAAAAGVSKGTLYNYYQDKDALVQEVIERAFGPVTEGVDAAMAAGGEPRRLLAEVLCVVLQGVEERRALGQALCAGELSARLTGALRSKQLWLRRRFTEVIGRVQGQGVSRFPGLGAEALGRFLAVVLGGMVRERMLHGGDCPPVEEEVAQIETLILRPWFGEGC